MCIIASYEPIPGAVFHDRPSACSNSSAIPLSRAKNSAATRPRRWCSSVWYTSNFYRIPRAFRMPFRIFPRRQRNSGPRPTAVSDGVDHGYKSSSQLRRRRHTMTNAAAEQLRVHGIELEALRRGSGRPILALHGFDTIDPAASFLDLFGRHGEIIAPSSPGFGNSSRPKDFDTVYDLVHLYLAALDELPGDLVTLLGFSFGGWLAAEVAAACSHRLEKLILVDPLGIKISDRETPDILDVFNKSPDEVRRRS